MLIMCSGGQGAKGPQFKSRLCQLTCSATSGRSLPTPPHIQMFMNWVPIHPFTHSSYHWYWAPTLCKALVASTLQELPDQWGVRGRDKKVTYNVMGTEGPEETPELLEKWRSGWFGQ